MNFERALSFILQFEGHYVCDPKDPGGETKFGISKRAYPKLDIKNLTLEEATVLYRRDYWDAVGCEKLSIPFRLPVFDCAVNQGRSFALSLLSYVRTEDELGLALFMARRAKSYAKHPAFEHFGAGWMKRLFLVALEAGKLMKKEEGFKH